MKNKQKLEELRNLKFEDVKEGNDERIYSGKEYSIDMYVDYDFLDCEFRVCKNNEGHLNLHANKDSYAEALHFVIDYVMARETFVDYHAPIKLTEKATPGKLESYGFVRDNNAMYEFKSNPMYVCVDFETNGVDVYCINGGHDVPKILLEMHKDGVIE